MNETLNIKLDLGLLQKLVSVRVRWTSFPPRVSISAKPLLVEIIALLNLVPNYENHADLFYERAKAIQERIASDA